MAETLTWDILARDRMSDVLERLSRATERLEGHLRRTGSEASEMGRKLGQAEPHAQKLHSGLERLGEGATATLGRLKSFGVGAAAVFGAAGAAAAGFGIKSAAGFEASMVSFKTMLGGKGPAQQFLDQLAAFGERTPFDLVGLQQVGSQLLAAGFAARDVIPLLTRLGDATTAMGTGAEGINRAVYALGQMKRAGKVTLEDLNQLTDAGIPALDAVAAHLGITTGKVYELVSGGKITPSEVFASILTGADANSKRFAGLMDEMSATAIGKWSNFKDKMNRTAGQLFAPTLPALKAFLDFAASAPDRLKRVFTAGEFGTRFVATLDRLGHQILPFVRAELGNLQRTFEQNREGLEKFGRFIAEVVVPIVGYTLAGAIKIVSESIQGTIRLIAFMGESWERTKGAVGTFAKFLVDVVVFSFGAVLHGAELGFGWIPGLGPKLKKAAEDFDRFIAQVKANIDSITGDHPITFTAKYLPPAKGSSGTQSHFKAVATGGLVTGGQMYRVGENGPEDLYLTPDTAGRVTPNNQMSASGGRDVAEVDVLLNFRDRASGELVQRELLTLARRRGYRTLAQLLPI